MACLLVAAAARGGEAAPVLDWDAVEKEYTARPGEVVANFEFTATNRTAAPVLVFEAEPSCGCTTAQLPAHPWPLARGASGVLKLAVDLIGKHGVLEKSVEVRSSVGNDTLRLRIIIPEGPETAAMDRRAGNTRIARANRQAVFEGACVSCHVPANPGRTGAEIFRSTCAICHESPHRASMVPDLAERGAGKNADYWTQWIESGREDSLMPAFAARNHGILARDQVARLVEYLTQRHGGAPRTVGFDRDLADWSVEQAPGGSVAVRDGALIIEDEGGCTVWLRQKLSAPVEISYDVTVVAKDGPHDRVSDVNCFWMATDPKTAAMPAGRSGKFEDYDSLRTYYVGMGGNDNTTTRFRRYAGDGTKPLRPEHDLRARPFLLEANATYHLRLVARDGRAEFWRNGEKILSYADPEPLREGWFGLRTVHSHLEIRQVRIAP